MADGIPFGNYRLLRRLARGGMAEVFLARHLGVEGFERRVAIKRILPHLSESEEFITMFLDEARLAAQLTHPNIVHIYDFGKVEDYHYIAMEYVDGVDLGRLIRQAKARPVPFEFAARILADVCGGLHYAHNVCDPEGRRLDLVHRDVTPQNILVTYDGVVKLVDFGIAKAAWSAAQTRPGVVKGKFAYMSPEQVEGRALDGRTDVFSAAICLYELLTGAPLFRRDDVKASMREIRRGKPIELESSRPDAPGSLVAILRRALATEREERYPSAGAMQLDLEKFLKESAALATAPLLGEYLRRETPRLPDEEAAEPAGTEAQDAHVPNVNDAPTRPVAAPPPRPGGVDRSSSHTAVVAPYERSRQNAYLAAAVAAATVLVGGLLALRPWAQTEPTIEIMPSEPRVVPRRELDPPRGVEPGREPERALGYLSVRTTPRSKVYESARLLGTTPLLNLPLDAGVHALTFVHPARRPLHRTVQIQPGEEARLDLELRK